MSVIVHGTAGGSISASGPARYGGETARRASAFEVSAGAALERWLGDMPGEFHLFHDLTGIRVATRGHGRSLGGANIDHVVLSDTGLLVVNAKGCGAGALEVRDGRGVLVRPDGTVRPERWLDLRRDYSLAAALVRDAELAGLRGRIAWVVPDTTDTSRASLRSARCLRFVRLAERPVFGRSALVSMGRVQFTGAVVQVHELLAGRLLAIWPRFFDGSGADPRDIASVARYVAR
jgi:hypothetical protein